jgi:hypothetical protein
MSYKTVTFYATGAGYDRLIAEGGLSQEFMKAVRAATDGTEVSFGRKGARIETSRDEFRKLARFLPQPVREAFQQADTAIERHDAEKSKGRKFWEGIRQGLSGLGQPAVYAESAVSGYTDTLVTVKSWRP